MPARPNAPTLSIRMRSPRSRMSAIVSDGMHAAVFICTATNRAAEGAGSLTFGVWTRFGR
jgi:hypothetical protein